MNVLGASRARRWAALAGLVAIAAVVSAVTIGSDVGRSAPPSQELVSAGTASTPTNGAREPSISADGAIVVFTQLDANGVSKAFVRDRAAKTSTAVPLPSGGTAATRQDRASVSADGCHVAFWSALPPSGAGAYQLYGWNRCTPGTPGAPALIPADTPLDLPAATALLARPSLSRDGRFVAYAAAKQPGAAWKVAIVDTSTSPTTERVLTSTPILVLTTVDVAADGSTVVYDAGPAAAPSSPTGVFAWSPAVGANAVQTVSAGASGAPATGTNAMPSISGDGRAVAFVSNSPDLAGVGGGATQLYVRELGAGASPGAVHLVTGTAQAPSTGNAVQPDLNADATQVAFAFGPAAAVPLPPAPALTSAATVVVARSTSGVFATSTSETVSTDAAGAAVAGTSAAPAVSATGRFTAYESNAGKALSAKPDFADGVNVWLAQRAPSLTVAASTDLGATDVGVRSRAVPVVFGNPSSVGLAVGQVAAPGNGFAIAADTCSNVVVPAGGSCTVTVAFTPTAAGAATANLVVAGEDQRATTALTGTGNQPRGTIAADTPTVQFDSTPVGGRSATVTVTIRNTGSRAVTISGDALQGSAPGQFFVTAHGCNGQTLAGGATCALSVVALPTAPGTSQASLVVSGSNGESASATLRVVAFTPTVTAPPTTARPGSLDAEPASVTFPTTPIGTTSEPATIRVSNGGGSAVSISSVAITGGGDQFGIVSDGCRSTQLAVGRTCTIAVAVQPTQGGEGAATLTIRGSRGESATVELTVESTFAPAITVAPGVVHAGDLLRVSGTNFPADRVVALQLAPSVGAAPPLPLASVSTDAAGTLTAAVVVPLGLAGGGWRIVVVDQADFTGVAAPLLLDVAGPEPGTATGAPGIGGVPRPGPVLPGAATPA